MPAGGEPLAGYEIHTTAALRHIGFAASLEARMNVSPRAFRLARGSETNVNEAIPAIPVARKSDFYDLTGLLKERSGLGPS